MPMRFAAAFEPVLAQGIAAQQSYEQVQAAEFCVLLFGGQVCRKLKGFAAVFGVAFRIHNQKIRFPPAVRQQRQMLTNSEKNPTICKLLQIDYKKFAIRPDFAMPVFAFWYGFACLIIFLSGCRLDTEALTTVDTLAKDIPNIVITEVEYKELENSLLTQEVYAQEFRIFSRDGLVEVRGGRVQTYREGEAQISGNASWARYNQRTEDSDVDGPIEVYYYPEKTRILAQKLYWVRSERTLRSEPGSLVEIEQEDGTRFQGRDLVVDMSTKTVSYNRDVEGQLYVSE